MAERTWVVFTAASQAQPGRRMRAAAWAANTYIVQRRALYRRRPHVFFEGCGSLEVAWLKGQRWQVEV